MGYFLKFLHEESERIRKKSTKNTESNILHKAKKTKFGVEKYVEKKYSAIHKASSNEFIITNFQWLRYANNSCRYDVFTTLYIFFLYDFIYERLNSYE